MSNATLFITDDSGELSMEASYSGVDYDPTAKPHQFVALFWNYLQDASEHAEAMSKPQILLPGGGI